MPPEQPQPGGIDQRLIWIGGGTIFVTLLLILASWDGLRPDSAPGMNGMLNLWWVLGTSLPIVIAWLAAASGYGWLLCSLLLPQTRVSFIIQCGVGAAVLLWLEAGLGRLGMLQWGGSIGGWLLLGGGWVASATLLGRKIKENRNYDFQIPGLLWTALPALVVLIVASCSAPGWLWATEFAGYDALSYHLQLPQEWLNPGRITLLEHNIYSALPSYMEGAYYHLSVLRGSAIEAAYSCQLLHGSFALLTAAAVFDLGVRWIGRTAGAMAAVLFLGTPWVIVTGSLAYNELAVTLLLATGLLILDNREIDSTRRAILIGFLAGCACGAKLTAVGFVAVPLFGLMIYSEPLKKWSLIALLSSSAVLIAGFPYLLGNWVATDNPVFPFAASWFGFAHWTPAQVAIWTAAHDSALPIAERFIEAWHQWFRFGLGESPYEKEPWIPQWSILPWLTLAGLFVGLIRPRLRPLALKIVVILIIQLAFWMSFTHIKARFMLPAAIPCALAASLLLETFRSLLPRTPARFALAVFLLAWSSLPLWLFRREVDEQPAAMIGLHHLLLDDGPRGLRKALLLGDATPFYLRFPLSYQTTWDRGVFSTLMEEYPDDPDRWATELKKMGFTHLLVNPSMLERWMQAGWNDPNLTPSRVMSFIHTHTEPSGAIQGSRVYILR